MLKNMILGFFFIFFFISLRKTDAGTCLGKIVSETPLSSERIVNRQAGNVENRSDHHSTAWHFSYQNVAEWGRHYPDCNGKRQSPIDLNSKLMNQLTVKQPFIWTGYGRTPRTMTIVHGGHSVALKGYWDDENTPCISGGTLMGEYLFDELHFHWGVSDETGSEHTINNISLPLEMHIVHYKKSYGSREEALRNEDGLAVIGLLFKINKIRNNGIQIMQKYFGAIKSPGDAMTIKPFPLSKFDLNFPGEFVSYFGSLTTPPCREAVTWIIPAIPRSINQKQIDIFRKINLFGGDDHNNRPTMPLNGRMIYYIEY